MQTIKIINPDTDLRWNDFVKNHPCGTVYHLTYWVKVISTSFRHEPVYLAIENQETLQLEGVFPVMFMRSWLTGNRLVSLPLTTHCDLLISEEQLDWVKSFLMKKFAGVKHLQLKLLNPTANALNLELNDSEFVTHFLDLDRSLDDIFGSFQKTSIRQRINRSRKHNLNHRVATDEQDLIVFYKLFTSSRRRHGLPPQPYSFFRNMWRILQPMGLLELHLVEYGSEVIAGAVILKYKDRYYGEYIAVNYDYKKLNANHKLIWEIIRSAHDNGAKLFDLGRSSTYNPSLIKFKDRWGADKHPLYYYYSPGTRSIDTHGNLEFGRRILNFANQHLPQKLLQLEGRFLYSHIG
jgi:hypothetical protein